MKTRLFKQNTITRAVASGLLLGSLSLSLTGCGSDSVEAFDGASEDRPAFFLVNGKGAIEQGSEMEVAVSAGEIAFELFDETDLKSYQITLGDDYSSSGDITDEAIVDYNYAKHTVTVSYDELELNKQYDVSLSITDSADQQTTRDFKITVVTDPYRAVGSATPNGWSITAAQYVKETSEGIYEWTGLLTQGEIKFFFYDPENLDEGVTDQWCGGPWVIATEAGAVPASDGSGNAYSRYELPDCPNNNGIPDNKWSIQDAGEYKITIDTNAERIYFDLLGGIEFYSNLYMVGDATETGWNHTDTSPLVNAGTDTLFGWAGPLTSGEFKIATTADGSWGGAWIQPLTQGQALTETSYGVSVDGDPKWVINQGEEGYYSIKIEQSSENIEIFRIDNLYAVGSALEQEWNLDGNYPLAQDASDPALFSGMVTLKAGELKFATKNTWDAGYAWIHPATAEQSLAETGYNLGIAGHAEDSKWAISAADAGDYKITVDMTAKTILFEKQ